MKTSLPNSRRQSCSPLAATVRLLGSGKRHGSGSYERCQVRRTLIMTSPHEGQPRRRGRQQPGYADEAPIRSRTTGCDAARPYCATRDGAAGSLPDHRCATRRRSRSSTAPRRAATPSVERKRRPGASVALSASMPKATVARARRTGTVAGSRPLWDWSQESRTPSGLRQCASPHRRHCDPAQATRASGHLRGRRTAIRTHAPVVLALGRRSRAGSRRLPAPPGAVHG